MLRVFGAVSAEDFVLEVGDARLQFCVLHAPHFGLDRIDLRVKRDDLVFGGYVVF